MTTSHAADQAPSRSTVAVVGMGPVGMVTALALAQQGVDVTVLEAGPALADESRASTFHPPTLEILDDLGVSEALHKRGLVAPNFQYRDRDGTVLADLDVGLLSGDTRFPYRLQSEQNNLTEIIAERLAVLPNVQLRFDSPVQRVERGSDGVRVFLPQDAREPSVTADWLVAADGARSAVRRSLGIAFEGVTYPERFLVASTTHDFRDDIRDLAYVSYISDPQDWGVLLRTPRHWRVLMPVPSDVSDEHACDPAVVEKRLQALAPRVGRYPVDHITIYNVHQRVASTFAVGHVLLAGDAAHANNPLGGMGMNSGIHDARAAADVILAALDGSDPALCAQAYDRARREAAISYVQKQAQRNYDDLQETDARARHHRTTVLAAVASDPQRARSYLLQTSMITSLAASRARLRAGLRPAAAVTRTPAGRRLAQLLADGSLMVPGCHDAVSARLAAASGFRAGYMSGASVSATSLGAPDLGYVGLEEMLAQLRRLTVSTDLPIIADADAGYGGPLQAARTVRAYERAGAAAAQLEDQRLPKRCGHMDGKDLVTVDEMVGKVAAAVDARSELLVVARTDAFSIEGFDGVLWRAQAYARAGADLIFAEGVHDPVQLAELYRVTGVPQVLSRSEAAAGGNEPTDLELLAGCGVGLVIYPVAGLLAAAAAVRSVYHSIAATSRADTSGQLAWGELTDLLDLPALLRDEQHYATSNSLTRRTG